MCDPVTITVMAVASAGTQAYGAYKASKAQQEALKYQSVIARNNQVVAQRQAEERRAIGVEEEKNYRKKLETIKGKQRAGYAEAGVVVDVDTPLDILSETAELGEIDALTIRRNAEREAYGIEAQGQNYADQASLLATEAKNISPWFNTSATFLTGLSQSTGSIISAGGFGSRTSPKTSTTGEVTNG